MVIDAYPGQWPGLVCGAPLGQPTPVLRESSWEENIHRLRREKLALILAFSPGAKESRRMWNDHSGLRRQSVSADAALDASNPASKSSDAARKHRG